MIITNAQLTGRLKLLADQHAKADSGTTTTLVCKDLIGNGDIRNSFICFISDANTGTDRIITAYDDTSGEVTFDTLDDAVTNMTEFCITKAGYQSDVAQAEQAIRNDLRNSGYDLDDFTNEPQLQEMYIYKTLELICAGLFNDATDEDAYYANYERFKTAYGSESVSLVADYDANQDGTADDSEELLNIGQIRFTR